MIRLFLRLLTAGDVLPPAQSVAWRMLVAFGLPNVGLAALLWTGLAFAGLDASWSASARALVVGLTPFLLAFGVFLGVSLARHRAQRGALWAALRGTSTPSA